MQIHIIYKALIMEKLLLSILLGVVSVFRAGMTAAGIYLIYLIVIVFFFDVKMTKTEDYVLPTIVAVLVFISLLLNDISWLKKETDKILNYEKN